MSGFFRVRLKSRPSITFVTDIGFDSAWGACVINLMGCSMLQGGSGMHGRIDKGSPRLGSCSRPYAYLSRRMVPADGQ
jgi:hypothetical protein